MDNFITNYKIIKLKSNTITQNFKLVNTINYNQITSLFNIIISKQIELNQIYMLQQESNQLEFITNYKIIKFNTLPINTNYLLIDTDILSQDLQYYTKFLDILITSGSTFNLYKIYQNSFNLEYTIDGTFTRIKNYNLQYSLSDYTGSILFGFDIEYVIIQCPRLKHYWY